MKIAILCPIGPLDRFGYQYNHMITLQSFSEFADHIYLCSSTRTDAYIDKVLATFNNVTYISDERTWFEEDEEGNEFFSVFDFERNNDVALESCLADGMDCALHIHINQYIERRGFSALRTRIANLLQSREPFDWLYRRYQLYDRLFYTDTRHPWMLNLQVKNPPRLRADAILYKGVKYTFEVKDFRQQKDGVIVDCNMELSLEDLADVRNFTRGYVELNPEANPIFDWEVYRPYYINKFNHKILSDDALDYFGQQIAQNSQPDFVSHLLLDNYNPSLLVKVMSQIRFTLETLL